jgi:ATP-binding cassette subfamily F protein 3
MVCDSFWRVADGKVESFDGDLDDYARWLRARGTGQKKSEEAEGPPAVSAADRRRAAAAQRENEKATRQRVKKIETRMAAIDDELARLEAKLSDPDTYNGPTAELMKLGQRQGELRREKETLEGEWLELYELLEA